MQKITSLYKKINGLCIAILLLLGSSVVAQSVVLQDDFNSVTAGNNTQTSGSSTLWQGNDNFPADGLLRAYQAGQAVRIGTGTQTGYITTMPLNLSEGSGNFSVTVHVKGWTNIEGSLKVIHLTSSGQTEQTVTYTATIADAFEVHTVNFTGGTAASQIRFETTAKRAFIDFVSVTATCGDVAVPVAEAQAFCGSATVAQLVAATGANLQWYAQAEGGTALDTGSALATGTYYVSQTVNGCESQRLPVSVSINAVPDAPTATAQAFCDGSTVNQLSATGTGLQWYLSASGGEALAQGEELTTGTYYVSQSVNGCESQRQAVQITVNTIASPDAVPAQSFCNGAVVDELAAEGTGILWYTSAEGGTALNPADPLAEATYYASQTIGDCESQRVSVVVDIIEVDIPQGEATQMFTAGQTLANLQVTGNSMQWFMDESLTMPLPADTVLIDGSTYYVIATEGLCTSSPLAITVTEVLGVAGATMQNLHYYPNPVQDVLEIINAEPNSTVYIYNVLGQAVPVTTTGSTTLKVDMSVLPAGTYFLTVSSGKQQHKIKVLKQ